MIRVFFLLLLCACDAVPEITYVEGGDNTCGSLVVPPFADICCGAVPCKGVNCVAACNDCESACKTTDLCCPNAQARAVCRPNLQCQAPDGGP